MAIINLWVSKEKLTGPCDFADSKGFFSYMDSQEHASFLAAHRSRNITGVVNMIFNSQYCENLDFDDI